MARVSVLQRALRGSAWEFRYRTFTHYGIIALGAIIHEQNAGVAPHGAFAYLGPVAGAAAATLVLFVGLALRTWALSALPAGTSLSLTPRTEVRVTGGAYGFVSHPIYVGGFLTFLAFGFMLHPVALALIVVISFVRYLRLARYEEEQFHHRSTSEPVDAPAAGRLTLRFWALTELRFVGYGLGFWLCAWSLDVRHVWIPICALTLIEGVLVAIDRRYLRLSSILALLLAPVVLAWSPTMAAESSHDAGRGDRIAHFARSGEEDSELPVSVFDVLFLAWVDAYRHGVSPSGMKECGMYPNCSRYFREASLRHGGCLGCMMSVDRVFRCNGGADNRDRYPRILTPHGTLKYDPVDENDYWFGESSENLDAKEATWPDP